MMANERDFQVIAEILRANAYAFGGKNGLLNIVSKLTGVMLPKSISYGHLVRMIAEKGLEKDFCAAVFGADSFKIVESRYVVTQGLSLLSASEVFEVADYLSNKSPTWNYDKRSATAAIMAVAERASLKDVNECLSALMTEGRIELLTRQDKKWVLGPLGIEQAVEYRRAGIVWSIRDIFDEELSDEFLDEFTRRSPWIPEQTPPPGASAEYKRQALIQLALVHGTEQQILAAFNRLIADGVLSLKMIRTYNWSVVGTPCGVFMRGNDGVSNLAQLIVSEFEEEQLRAQLSQKGCFSADLVLGATEMCLREDPVGILTEFFGWTHLKRVAQNLNLVRLQSIDKAQLADVVAVRLGFRLPIPAQGCAQLIDSIEKTIASASAPTSSLDELNGVMAGIYRSLEVVLKEILYFYASFLWPETLTKVERSERRETFDVFCREQFSTVDGIDRGVDRLTVGQLVEVLKALNRQVRQDERLMAKFAAHFGRKYVLPSNLLSTLEASLKARRYVAHDKGQAGKDERSLRREFVEALRRMKEFLTEIKSRGLYPVAVRIKRSVTDEYDRHYTEAVDEDSKSWLIYSDEIRFWSDESYLMHSITDHIAVNPFLSARLQQ